MYSIQKLISKKNKGEAFTKSEIDFIVAGYTIGKISDKDMAGWLQSVFDFGMNTKETRNYTHSMLNSGERIDFSYLDGFVIDKHSTGGVGDKVSIVLGPILAACGCYVPMLAGRGLEHTGGTIDKLETIPGYKAELSLDKFKNIVENVGVSIMSQTIDICPADRKIYALRDITNTVASLPLICGSIMSKKIAEGIEGLILDIKIGNGAFIQTIQEGKQLSKILKDVGDLYNLKVKICYTDMNQPLGKSSGLWLEILECVECLKNNGPNDLMKVVYHLGNEALKLAGISNPQQKMQSSIENGSAFDKFKSMVKAHGGDINSLENKDINQAIFSKSIIANEDGYISSIDTTGAGNAITLLGGGRLDKRDVLDPTVGINFFKKLGDKVSRGDVLATYFASNKFKVEKNNFLLEKLYSIDKLKPVEIPLIY